MHMFGVAGLAAAQCVTMLLLFFGKPALQMIMFFCLRPNSGFVADPGSLILILPGFKSFIA